MAAKVRPALPLTGNPRTKNLIWLLSSFTRPLCAANHD
jgi:hypothetical protein